MHPPQLLLDQFWKFVQAPERRPVHAQAALTPITLLRTLLTVGSGPFLMVGAGLSPAGAQMPGAPPGVTASRNQRPLGRSHVFLSPSPLPCRPMLPMTMQRQGGFYWVCSMTATDKMFSKGEPSFCSSIKLIHETSDNGTSRT